jgi:hypothetical protein
LIVGVFEDMLMCIKNSNISLRCADMWREAVQLFLHMDLNTAASF